MPYRIKGDNKELPMVHEKIARIKSKITKIIDDENVCSSAIYIRKLQNNSKLFFEKKIRFAKMFHEMDRSQKIRKIIGINEINYKCN